MNCPYCTERVTLSKWSLHSQSCAEKKVFQKQLKDGSLPQFAGVPAVDVPDQSPPVDPPEDDFDKMSKGELAELLTEAEVEIPRGSNKSALVALARQTFNEALEQLVEGE